MDLSRLSDADLQAIADGDMSRVSTDGLRVISGEQAKNKPSGKPTPTPALERFGMGLTDPIHGGAQLLTKALPDPVVAAGNAINNWLARNTGLVSEVPAGGVDQMVREREAGYVKPEGMDWARLGGNVASPVSLALGAAGGMASSAGLGAKMATGASTGAAAGALAPVIGDDFWSEKGMQAGSGATFGGITPAAVAGASRVLSPRASVNPDIKTLMQAGVRPTIGQTLGGMANRIEEKAISVPFVGDAIVGARRKANEQLTRAVAQRALDPVKAQVPKNMLGRDLVAYVADKLGNEYDDVLKGVTVQADSQFSSEIASLRHMVNTGSINPNVAGTFNRILQNDVMSKFKGQNVLTGQTMKDIESDLGQMAARYASSGDPDARLLGDALREVQSSLRGMVARSNPKVAERVKALNSGWANYKRLERAASYVGAEEGAFNAAQLQSAVKALDRTKDKGGFAKGQAFMQDLSDPAKNVLGSKVPNSGTADRMFLGGAGLGAAYLEPMTLFAPVIGAGMYTSPMQSLLRGAVSARPGFAQPVAGLLDQSAPMLAPAGGLLGVEVMK